MTPSTPRPTTEPTPAALPRVGVAVLVQRQGRVLLGRRRGAHGAATWALPGGHLEFGESPSACARRELAEETGLHATRLHAGPYTNDVFSAEGRHYVTLFMLAEVADGEPQLLEPDKCDGWHWCDWHALPQPLFQPVQSLLASGWAPPEGVQLTR